MEILGPLHVHLPVVLSELDHDGGHESPLRTLGVYAFRGRDEGDVALLEQLQQIVEVLAITGQPVQLLNDDALDLALLDGLKKPLDGGALEILARSSPSAMWPVKSRLVGSTALDRCSSSSVAASAGKAMSRPACASYADLI